MEPLSIKKDVRLGRNIFPHKSFNENSRTGLTRKKMLFMMSNTEDLPDELWRILKR